MHWTVGEMVNCKRCGTRHDYEIMCPVCLEEFEAAMQEQYNNHNVQFRKLYSVCYYPKERII